MPDFILDQTPLPKIPVGTDTPQVTNAPLVSDDMYNSMLKASVTNQPLWMSDANKSARNPWKTQLETTIKYDDPNLGFNPFDVNQEDTYARAHPWKNFFNNVTQGTAKFLGAGIETIGTIPLAINAIAQGKFSSLYDNDFTNGINSFIGSVESAFPTYQTNYSKEHPIMQYLNIFDPVSLSGAIGSGINTVGFMTGAIAGALVEDTIITGLTGGVGLFPAAGAQALMLTRLGRAGRAIVAAPEEAIGAAKVILNTEKVVGDLAKAGSAINKTEDVVTGAERAAAQEAPVLAEAPAMANAERAANAPLGAEATTAIPTEATAAARTAETANPTRLGAEDVLAAKKAEDIQSIVKNNANYFKIRDAVKYNLALLSSGMSIGAFQSSEIYNNGIKQLTEKYVETNGDMPKGDDLKEILNTSRESANIAMGANIALTYLTARLNFGSLFKPTTQAFDESIIGWGKGIATARVERSAIDDAGQIAYTKVITKPEDTIGKILLNARKLGAKTGLAAGEATQFGLLGTISEASLDYNLKKYDVLQRGGVADYVTSFGKGLSHSFGSDEGLQSVMQGFVMGLFVSPLIHKVRAGKGQLTADQQIQQRVDLMNSTTIRGSFETAFKEAAVQSALASEHKDAVDNQSVLDSKNVKHNMLFNWVTTGIKTNMYDARIEELDAIRNLDSKGFQSYWSREDTPENRRDVDTFLDGIKQKADAIKKDYTRVASITRNPYDRSKNPEDYEAYDSYMDQLALSLTTSRDALTRLRGIRDGLNLLSPGLRIQDAVDMTSIQGRQKLSKKMEIGIKTLNDQLSAAKDAKTDSETTGKIEKKISDLSELHEKVKKLMDVPIDANGDITNYHIDGSTVSEVMKDLYDLHIGADMFNNDYLLKRSNDQTAIDLTSLNQVTDIDGLAKSFTDIQDLYSLSEVNLHMQRMYNYLRTGKGADEYIKSLKAAVQANIKKYMDENGNVKSPEELRATIEEDVRAEKGDSFESEEATKEERDAIVTIAKKLATGDPLTPEESSLAESKPVRTATEAKVQMEVNKQMAEVFGEGMGNDNLDASPSNLEPSDVPGETFSVKNLFGMFSQDRGTDKKDRTNLYSFLFKTKKGGRGLTGLTAQHLLLEPDSITYSNIPGTKLFRRVFTEAITMFHEGDQVGMLRPPDTVWLDKEGRRSVYDMTKEEYVDITGNEESTYKGFMDRLNAYRDSYNALKEEVLAHPEKALNYPEIAKHFTIKVNYGARVQNGYTIKDTGTGFKIYHPNGTVVRVEPTLQQANAWKNGNTYKLAQLDTLVKDLNYKPKGTAIVRVEEVIKNGVKDTEVNILNPEELTQSQLAKANAFLEANKRLFVGQEGKTVGAYSLLLPLNGEYLAKAVVAIRNAETTIDDRSDFFNMIKDVANGLTPKDSLGEVADELNKKFFFADGSRKTKGTEITVDFNENGDAVFNIRGRNTIGGKDITIRKDQILNSNNFGDFMKTLSSEIYNAGVSDKPFGKLGVDIVDDSLKLQIPKDITKLSQIANVMKAATSPDVFKNFNLDFEPGASEAKTVEPTPETKPIELKAPNPVVERIQTSTQEGSQTLKDDWHASLTPDEMKVVDALKADSTLGANIPALIKASGVDIDVIDSLVSKAKDFQEKNDALKSAEAKKIEDALKDNNIQPTDVSKEEGSARGDVGKSIVTTPPGEDNGYRTELPLSEVLANQDSKHFDLGNNISAIVTDKIVYLIDKNYPNSNENYIVEKIYKNSKGELSKINKPNLEIITKANKQNLEERYNRLNLAREILEQSLRAQEVKGNNKPTISKEQQPTDVSKVEPIRQLGTGANVYFETNKYRVNDDTKGGKFLLNVGDKNSDAPLANIEFDNANEAVFVAKKLQENAPDGLVSDFHNVDKIIDNYKKEFREQPNIKEEAPIVKDSSAINNHPEIKALEEQKQKEIDAITKPSIQLNFVEKDDPSLDGLTGKKITVKSETGRKMKVDETFKDKQDELIEKQNKLEQLINCLWG